jgi:segregation and condensation protein B
MALTTPALLEAVLFSAGESVRKERLAKLLSISDKELADTVGVLRQALSGHGLALVETDTELEIRTAPEAAEILSAYREAELARDIGKASLETLAMIVYKGGAARSEIDWVRGVNSAAALRSLTLRGLIERTEDPTDKRKVRYQATIEALSHLGVDKKESLPRYAEFTKTLDEHEATLVQSETP